MSTSPRLLLLARAAVVAVMAGTLVLLTVAVAAAQPRPDLPGEAPGGTLLTYSVAAEDPGALLRRPMTESPSAARQDGGRHLLAVDWQKEPPVPDSLSPHFDQTSCLACHLEGLERDEARRRQPPPVARLLHPADLARYDGQVNIRAVKGTTPQGRVRVQWEETPLTLADGTEIGLRRPWVQVEPAVDGGDVTLAGPIVLRIPPALFGWGLLEAVPETFLHHIADPNDADGDGISGRVSRVEDPARRRLVVGRFGWKAEQPTLRHQTAAALYNDMGITTALFPDPNCSQTGRVCEPELTADRLDAMVRAQRFLGVPDRRRRDAPEIDRGRQVFERLGCDACHLPVMNTALDAAPALADQVIWPYSDLLLHDMGEGLADPSLGTDNPKAREWRTAPLWGIGLMAERFPERGFLHDGRARTLLEAILWHGGEAASARARTLTLHRDERASLIAFLESL